MATTASQSLAELTDQITQLTKDKEASIVALTTDKESLTRDNATLVQEMTETELERVRACLAR